MPNPVKSLGYLKCYSLSSPRPVKKTKKFLSDTTVKRSAVEIRKKARFLYMVKKPINYKFFKDFTNYRKQINRVVVFCNRFLNKGTTYEIFQQSRKQDSLTYILKSSASIYYKTSGSQFFRTITRMQSRPDTPDKSGLAMNFLTNMGVT